MAEQLSYKQSLGSDIPKVEGSNPSSPTKNLNKNCPYYPCHDGLEDCTFCFCPFYPCGDKEKGGYWKKNIWCCENCRWIHKKETADKIKLKEIFNEL